MNRYLAKDYLPKGEVWLVFDLSNGDSTSRRYVWWFDSRKEARRFISHHKTLKYASTLSTPLKFVSSK